MIRLPRREKQQQQQYSLVFVVFRIKSPGNQALKLSTFLSLLGIQ